MKTNYIYCGHVLDILKTFPDECVNTIITSPPYFGLRDYGEDTKTIWDRDKDCQHEWENETTRLLHEYRQGKGSEQLKVKSDTLMGFHKQNAPFCKKCGAWYGQLGLEPTLDLYISHLLQITAELKRVLRKDGIMFWNQGDSYGSHRDWTYSDIALKKKLGEGGKQVALPNLEKCLLLQNYRLILKMIDEQGWILRNTITWYKKNHMPSSVKDRFANAYEPVFMLTKNNDPIYYYNVKTGLMADRKPKVLKEGIDWDWKEVPDFSKEKDIEGKGSKTQRSVSPEDSGSGGDYSYGGINSPFTTTKGKVSKLPTKRKKVSYWRGLDYWFDLDAVRLPHKDIRDYERHAPFNYRVREAKKEHFGIIGVKSTQEEMLRYDNKGQTRGPEYKGKWKDNQRYMNELQQRINDARARGIPHDFALSDPRGKNPGDVWRIATQPFPEAHFATFPEKLVDPMILAGCPQWVCKKCGKARRRITKPNEEYAKFLGTWTQDTDKSKQLRDKIGFQAHTKKKALTADYQTMGWTNCRCNAGWEAGIVLDPFMGAGTVGVVATKLGRNYVGIDIKPEYCQMAEKRIKNITPLLDLKIPEQAE